MNVFDYKLPQMVTCRRLGVRWPSGRALDSRAIDRGFDTYLCYIVSLSKDTFCDVQLFAYAKTKTQISCTLTVRNSQQLSHLDYFLPVFGLF